MSELSPHLFVIFGATGDLNRRKLLPALFHVAGERDELQCCHVLGVSRSEHSDEWMRKEARAALSERGFSDDDLDRWCDSNLYYHGLGDDADAGYLRLAERIRTLEREHDLPGNRVFYLALPPKAFPPTIEAIGTHGLNVSEGWTRLVVEKPFGRDLESAHALNELVHRHFREDQVYRIDHYLGKETVQNLLAFRFGNALFETVWNRDQIRRVEISVDESLGVGRRAGYYDGSGALRDMVQNHLTQLLMLVAMEAPTAFRSDAIRREKIKVLESISHIDPKRVTFGQYTAGEVDGETVPGYLEADGVSDDSRTPTFVRINLQVENWRWEGVPFILKTGKRLPEKRTEIKIWFRRAPVSIFQPYATTCSLSPNVLVIRLQPDEGFDLTFEVKKPRVPFQLKTQQFSFSYEDAFESLPDAYETLLLDVMEGDQTLFVHADEVEHAWRLYTPLLDGDIPLRPYEAGSEGPV